ncbi:MAG: hypothetical protein H0T46_20535 [Deltaproteobacteria bacterium]|nr:hypothetical protein [Deltaproteobacteria bacterium]
MTTTRLLGLLLLIAACGTDEGPGGGPPTLGTTPKQWDYVPVPGSKCMNGTDTGIGVNLGTSGDLVIYMEGGGACFNSSTCNSVAHPSGWNASNFASEIGLYNVGLFDRIDDKNPLKDATFIFIPYCTGDVHSGSNPNGMGGRAFVGYANVGHDLDLIIAQSADVKRVVLTGSSAGGFGALINYDRTATAFGDTPVFLLDDSGPPLGDQYLAPCLQQKFREAWNLDAAIPAGCTACKQANGGGLANALGFLADKYPDRRFGLITANRDGVIRSFYGYGYPDCVAGASGTPMPESAFSAGITQLRDETLASHDNFRVYTKDSGEHVWLLFPPDTVSPRKDGSGKHLATWINEMLDGDSGWASVSP